MSYDPDKEGDRRCKKVIREWLWDSILEVAKKVALLPGPDCLDIVEGLRQGKVSLETQFDLWEHKPDHMEKVKETCARIGLKNVNFHSENITDHFRRDYSVEKESPYDLIYFDYCGEYKDEISWMLEKNRYSLKHSVLAFTFSTAFRNNSFNIKNYIESAKTYVHLPANGFRRRAPEYSNYSGDKTKNSASDKALAICHKTLHDLDGASFYQHQISQKYLSEYMEYVDTGAPMVWFVLRPRHKYTSVIEEASPENCDNFKPVNSKLLHQIRACKAWITMHEKAGNPAGVLAQQAKLKKLEAAQ